MIGPAIPYLRYQVAAQLPGQLCCPIVGDATAICAPDDPARHDVNVKAVARPKPEEYPAEFPDVITLSDEKLRQGVLLREHRAEPVYEVDRTVGEVAQAHEPAALTAPELGPEPPPDSAVAIHFR